MLPASFWRRFAAIENVIAIKVAPFDRYRTLDVIRGVVEAEAEDRIAIYTGNDHHIICDLMVPFDLVRGNAVKVLTVLCFTALSLALFAVNGRVDWAMGLALAVGTMIGGVAGARLTVLKGHSWVRGVVTVTMILFALKLWFSG